MWHLKLDLFLDYVWTGDWRQRTDERPGNTLQCNQEVGDPQESLGWNVILFPLVLWHCWSVDSKGIWHVGCWYVGGDN